MKPTIILTFVAIIFLAIVGGTATRNKSTNNEEDKMKNRTEDRKTETEVCENIAKDIEALKNRFPQLHNFETTKHLNREKCKIDYEYRCHKPKGRGGWTSGVPNPNPDGVWFYVGLWDEDDPVENMAQINTQPVIPHWYIKNKRVTFLILEGGKTNSIRNEIITILERYGLQTR